MELLVGLNPTIPLNPAGTLPLPAVSVLTANETSPAPTLTAAPDEEPPGTLLGSKAHLGVPKGERAPVKPVANWSKFVFPTRIAPREMRWLTMSALVDGINVVEGQPVVVGRQATFMLSFTLNGRPNNGGLLVLSGYLLERTPALARTVLSGRI